MAQAQKLIQVKCPNCGFTNMIPVHKRLNVEAPVKCEKCGSVLVKKCST